MKKRTTRMLATLLVLLSLFSVFAIGADAASTTNSITFSGGQTGGKSTDVYVKTGSTTASRKVQFSCTAEMLIDENFFGAHVFGSYEFSIYKWNGSSWLLEQNYDSYNKDSGTITLKQKNTYYKIHIYAWKSQTIYTSYWKNNVSIANSFGLLRFRSSYAYKSTSGVTWMDAPKMTLRPNKGCIMYTSRPV